MSCSVRPPLSWYSHVTPPPNKKNWFFYSHLSHHSQKKTKQRKNKKIAHPTCVINDNLVQFPKLLLLPVPLRSLHSVGYNFQLLVYYFLDEKHFLREIRLILLYEMGFSRNFFSDKNKTEPNWLVITFWTKNSLREIRLILLYKLGFSQNFFLKKQN